MKRILLIDDSESFRLLAAQLLSIEWPDIDIEDYDPVERGPITPDFDLKPYDLVLLDYRFGTQDHGLEWLAQLKLRPDCPPILFVTAHGSEDLAVASIKLGASDYLAKEGLSKANLISAIRNILQPTPHPETTLPASTHGAAGSSSLPSGSSLFAIKSSADDPDDAVTIGGYQLEGKIGVGGMARVFLARRDSDGLQVVLKILDARFTNSEIFLKRFVQEYSIIANIDSPYIVKMYEQGFTDRHVFIAMEYFAMGDLKQYAKNLAPDAAIRIFYQLMKALSVIHRAGVLHRDLKPHNVMFRSDGSLALVDFGIAKTLDHSDPLTTMGEILGTPYYMSPEQVRGEAIDGRTDLYSAGVMFYELLTGAKPFRGNSVMEIAEKHDKAPIPTLPPPLAGYQTMLNHLMAKTPGARYQSADEVLLELARHVRREPNSGSAE